MATEHVLYFVVPLALTHVLVAAHAGGRVTPARFAEVWGDDAQCAPPLRCALPPPPPSAPPSSLFVLVSMLEARGVAWHVATREAHASGVEAARLSLRTVWHTPVDGAEFLAELVRSPNGALELCVRAVLGGGSLLQRPKLAALVQQTIRGVLEH